jgi:hypothetical protein
MNQKEYRKKYVFSMKTPLSAKSLTKARSKAEKKGDCPRESAYDEKRYPFDTGFRVDFSVLLRCRSRCISV